MSVSGLIHVGGLIHGGCLYSGGGLIVGGLRYYMIHSYLYT